MARTTDRLWAAWRTGGDADAFRALVAPELPALFDLSRRLGAQPTDADDAVQFALAALAKERSDRPLRVGVGAWLMRTVRFRTLGLHRAARRRRRHESRAAHARTEPRTEVQRLDEQVDHALSTLAEPQRTLLLLRFLYDMDYAQIAVVLRSTEGACRVRVHRALAALRRKLGTDGRRLIALLPLAGVPKGFQFSPQAVAAVPVGSTVGVLAMSSSKSLALIAGTALLTWGGLHIAGFRRASSPMSVQAPGDRTSALRPGEVVLHAQPKTDETPALRVRIRELETQLAALRIQAPAETDAPIPPPQDADFAARLAWAARLPVDRGPGDRARLLKSCRALASEVERDAGAAAVFFRLLLHERDPNLLRVATHMIHAGAGQGLSGSQLTALVQQVPVEGDAARKRVLYEALVSESGRLEDPDEAKRLLQAESEPETQVRILQLLHGRRALYDKSWLERLVSEGSTTARVRTEAAKTFATRGDVPIRGLLRRANETADEELGLAWARGFLTRITQGPLSLKPDPEVGTLMEPMIAAYQRLREEADRRRMIERAIYATMNDELARDFLRRIQSEEPREALRALITRRLAMRDLYR